VAWAAHGHADMGGSCLTARGRRPPTARRAAGVAPPVGGLHPPHTRLLSRGRAGQRTCGGRTSPSPLVRFFALPDVCGRLTGCAHHLNKHRRNRLRAGSLPHLRLRATRRAFGLPPYGVTPACRLGRMVGHTHHTTHTLHAHTRLSWFRRRPLHRYIMPIHRPTPQLNLHMPAKPLLRQAVLG